MSAEEAPGLRKMVTEKQLLEILPTSRSSLRRWYRQGKFPKPVSLGPGKIAWFLDEVIEWQKKREGSLGSKTSVGLLVSETRVER